MGFVELGIAFFLKHYLVDFQWQTPYMYLNKGKFGHFGGILHSGFHALTTLAILLLWDASNDYALLLPTGMVIIAAIEFAVHYMTDWAKVNISKQFKWSASGKDQDGNSCLCIYSNNYFLAIGVDQTIHFLTYLWIIAEAFGNGFLTWVGPKAIIYFLGLQGLFY